MIFAMVLFVTALAPEVELLPPVVEGGWVTVHFSSREFYPEDGQRVKIQVSRSARFDDLVFEDSVSESPVLITGLTSGTYAVRALPTGGSYSNVVSFTIGAVDVPVPSLVELPGSDGAVSLRWSSVQADHFEIWHDEDPNFRFPRKTFFAGDQSSGEVNVSDLPGEGVVFLKIRASVDGVTGQWSNVVVADYDNTEAFTYVVPHVAGDGWETTLLISAPGNSSSVSVEAFYPGRGVFGGVEVRSEVLSVMPGTTTVFDLGSFLDREPLWFVTRSPIVAAVQYQAAGVFGVVQVGVYRGGYDSVVSGLLHKVEGGQAQKTAGVVLSNLGETDAVASVLISEVETNAEAVETVFVPALKSVVLHTGLLFSGDRSVTVSMTVKGENIAVMGAQFQHGECGLVPSFFAAEQYKVKVGAF